MFLNHISYIIKIWLFFELINWLTYLFVYINITSPKINSIKKKDMQKIIQNIDELTIDEIKYMIKGCILFVKRRLKKISVF